MSQTGEQTRSRIDLLKERRDRNAHRIFFAAAVTAVCALIIALNGFRFTKMRVEPIEYTAYRSNLSPGTYAETVVYDVIRLTILVNENPHSKDSQKLTSNYYVGTDENGEKVYFRMPLGGWRSDVISGTRIAGKTVSLSGATVTGNMLMEDFDFKEYLSVVNNKDSIYQRIKRVSVLDVDPDRPTMRLVPDGPSWLTFVLFAGIAFALCTYALIRNAGDINLQIMLLENQERNKALREAAERAMEYARQHAEKEKLIREAMIRADAAAKNAELQQKKLVLPDGLKRIDPKTMAMHKGIHTLVIPEGVTHIERGTFDECKLLERVTLPSTLRHIGERAFAGCPLQSVEIGRQIETIGQLAFTGCARLETVKIAAQAPLMRMEPFVFSNCESLKSVTLPDGLKEIGLSAFSCCSSLEEIRLPAALSSIDQRAFFSCAKLKRVHAGGLVMIASYAFANCEALEHFDFPEPLEMIGSRAFEGCALRKVCFPKTLRAVQANAFASCGRLRTVIPGGSWLIPRIEMFPDTPWGREKAKEKKPPAAIEPIALQRLFPQAVEQDGLLLLRDERGGCVMNAPGTAEIAVLGADPLCRLAVELHTGRLVKQTLGEDDAIKSVPVNREEALRLLAALPKNTARLEAQALCERLPCDNWRSILLGAPVTHNSYILYLYSLFDGKMTRCATQMDDPGCFLSAGQEMCISWEDVLRCSITAHPKAPGEATQEISYDPQAQLALLEDGVRTGWLSMTKAEQQYIRALFSACRLSDKLDFGGMKAEDAAFTLRIECLGMTFVQAFASGDEGGGQAVMKAYHEARDLLLRTMRVAA